MENSVFDTTEMKQALTLARNMSTYTKRELFSIAPMVDITDRHFRYFMRLLTKESFLYTEMLNEHCIIHSKKRDSILKFSEN